MWTFFMANEAKCLHKLQEDIENKRPTLCVGKQPAKRALSLLFTTVKYLDTCQQCKMKLVDYYYVILYMIDYQVVPDRK